MKEELRRIIFGYRTKAGRLFDIILLIAISASVILVILDTTALGKKYQDFFYITEDERNFMLTRPIEYVITQVQKSQFRMESGESKKAIMVNFKNPVKEMYFIAIKDGGIDEHTKINKVTLKFNNNTVIDADYMMLENEQPLKYHTGYPDTNSRFGLYSFSLKPETYRPTGQVNMSRVSHKLLEMELANSSGNTVRVYAVNYNVLRIESGLGG